MSQMKDATRNFALFFMRERHQQKLRLTKARHYALRPAYRWSISTSCVVGVLPSPPWLSSRSNNKPLPGLPHTPTWLPTAVSKLVLHDASSMASPSSHVPWQVGSRKCVSHPTIFRRPPLPRPPTWLDCEGRPGPDTWRPSCVWLPAARPHPGSLFLVVVSHAHAVHTKVVSAANWAPPCRGSPSTTTSNLRPSFTGTSKSMSLMNMLVRTRPPASRQILAATLSNAYPRRPNIPARTQAAAR